METGYEKCDITFATLLAMTCGMGGIQVVWSTVLVNGTAHLISLGLSKTWTPLIWLFAPLCGILVQPLMGILSDQSRLALGRRRPFIICGTLGAVVSMLLFAWAREIVAAILMFRAQEENDRMQLTMVIIFASLSVLALKVCVQPIQMGLRALIVDNIPSSHQARANIWTSCWVGVGSIVGHVAGSIEFDNSKTISRYQYLTLVASGCLIVTITLCCVCVQERTDPIAKSGRSSRSAILWDLFSTYRRTNSRVRRVFQIQFCAWMAWFPLLFYGSTYIAERYAASLITDKPELLHTQSRLGAQVTITDGEGAQLGSFTYLLFSIVALLSNLLLPCVLTPKPRHSRGILGTCAIPWASSYAMYAICMLSTLITKSWIGSAILIAYTGVPWAMTQWLPYAVIGEALANDYDEDERETNMGAIMGLHNVAISAPQIIVALTSSGILWIAAAMGNEDGIGWVLRASVLPALGAAYLTATAELI